MRKRITSLLLGLLLIPLWSSGQGRDQGFPILEVYDLDATDLTYCNTGAIAKGDGTVTTSGSSTTVTAAVTTAFNAVAAGDTIYFNLPSGRVVRYIASVTDGDTLVLTAAVNITAAAPFEYRERACGTTATDGWVNVQDYDTRNIILQIDQVVATGGISVHWQCKGRGDQAGPVKVWPGNGADCGSGTLSSGLCNFATGTTHAFSVVIDEPWAQCRVGLKIGSADDGDDLTTNAENVNIYFYGTRQVRP